MDSLIQFILDKSGSMSPSTDGTVAPNTVAGYNKFLAVQQRRMDDCAYLFATFDYSMFYHSEFASIFKAEPLTFPGSYWPGGGTALWGSIAHAITKTETHIKQLPAAERPANVTFIVMTDGDDNSESEHAVAKVKAHPDWRFIYLGRTGAEALSATGHERQRQLLGIPAEWTLLYDSSTAEERFELMAAAILDELTVGNTDGFKGV
jgi:hypothetical protein